VQNGGALDVREPSIELFQESWRRRELEAGRISSSGSPNAGLQLRRAISIQTEGTRLLEKHAIAPSAARLCSMAGDHTQSVSDLYGNNN
jgi:hypothetical protein